MSRCLVGDGLDGGMPWAAGSLTHHDGRDDDDVLLRREELQGELVMSLVVRWSVMSLQSWSFVDGHVPEQIRQMEQRKRRKRRGVGRQGKRAPVPADVHQPQLPYYL